MKKFIILFSLVFAQFTSVFGQKDQLTKIFDAYEDVEGVTSIKISKPMFGMLKKLDLNDTQLSQIQPLLGKINSLKMLIINKPELKNNKVAGLTNINEVINSTLQNIKYQEIMSVNNKEGRIKFLASEPKNGIMEDVLMNIDNGSDRMLILMDGKIAMNDLNNLFGDANTTATDASKTNSSTTTTTTDGNTVYISRSNFSDNTENYLSGETRNVAAFNGIEASRGVKVVFKQENSQSVKVITDADKLKNVKTEVENGILKIFVENKENKSLNFKNLTINVSAPKLQSLNTSSGAIFTALNTINENKMSIDASSGSIIKGKFDVKESTKISVSSGSNLSINLNSENVILRASSGSFSELVGKSTNLNVDVSSGAMAKTEDLKAANVSVESTSGSSVTVNAQKNLSAGASSGGAIRFRGNPTNIVSEVSKTSGGSLKAMD